MPHEGSVAHRFVQLTTSAISFVQPAFLDRGHSWGGMGCRGMGVGCSLVCERGMHVPLLTIAAFCPWEHRQGSMQLFPNREFW